jgi:NitT/TauT family transport system permease protein
MAAIMEQTASELRRQVEGRQRANRAERIQIVGWQVLILLVVLGIWEWTTRVPWFVEHTIMDPFFVSRPSAIAQRIYDWVLGAKRGMLWPHLASTLWATFLGLVVGVASGFAVGLILSQNRRLARILNPYVIALNSVPRIALVPLITMIFGLGVGSKVVTAWFMVFFLIFFNTFKGGQSIERELVDFCRTLGGTPRQITRTVRVPNALAWAFTALPNAVSFALIGVVISEFVGSTTGMGYLMITSLATLNSTDMFASVVVLSAVGVALVTLIRRAERRLLRWAPEFR